MDAQEYEKITQAYNDRQRKARNILIAIAGAMVVVMIIIITSIVGFFNDPQRAIAKESKALLKQAKQLVNEGDYASAVDVLNQISNDWDDYSTTNQVRQEAERGVMLEQINEYQKSGNYEALVAYVDSKISNVESDSEVYEVYATAKQKVKEKLLAEMSAYMSAGDYFGAIQYFYKAGDSLVNDTEAVTVYNEAVAAYADAVIQEAEAHAQAGDYASAKAVLSTAQNYIGWVVELDDKAYELSVREVTEGAKFYADAGNYKDAILYLNDHLDLVYGNPDLEAKLRTYAEKYRSNMISEAASEYKANGYEAAISVLNSALQILSNDSVLFSEMEKYENLAPVNIQNLKVFYSDFDGSRGQKKTYQTLNDKLGNTYENCLEYKWGRENSEDIYVLSGEYVRFEGTLFVPESRDNQGDNFNSHTAYQTMYFSIYGDGKLLYKSPEMGVKQHPVEISINVSGIQQLTIMWYAGAATWNCEIGLADAYLYKD